jgi:hypothetical protein
MKKLPRIGIKQGGDVARFGAEAWPGFSTNRFIPPSSEYFIMKHLLTRLILGAVMVAFATTMAFAVSGADAKARGRYDFYGKSSSRSMRSAREYSHDYRQHVQASPKAAVDGAIAKAAADSVGMCIDKATKDVEAMRAEAAGDKETLASLDRVSAKLAEAAKHHKAMHEMCCKENVDAEGSMACCSDIDKALEEASAEHAKLMKRLGVTSSPAEKK